MCLQLNVTLYTTNSRKRQTIPISNVNKLLSWVEGSWPLAVLFFVGVRGWGTLDYGYPPTYVIDTTVLMRKKILVSCTNFIVFFTGFYIFDLQDFTYNKKE